MELEIKGLKGMPDAGSFAEWKRNFYAIATSASGRGGACTRWLCETDVRGSHPDDFSVVATKWQSFDAKLAIAIKATVKGPLEVRVATQMDKAISLGQTMSGRSMLCMMFRYFEPNGRQFNTDSLQDIYDLKIKSSTLPSLELYLSHLDSLMLRCTGEQPSPDTMTCRFHRQVKAIPELDRDMQDYARMDDTATDRSYEWLRFRCEAALEIYRADGHRRDFARTLQGGGKVPGAAAQTKGGKEVCRMFQKSGTCRFGVNCTFAHAAARTPKAPKAPKGPSGQPAAPAAAPAPRRLRRLFLLPRPRGRAKGRKRSDELPLLLTPHTRRQLPQHLFPPRRELLALSRRSTRCATSTSNRAGATVATDAPLPTDPRARYRRPHRRRKARGRERRADEVSQL